MSTHKYQFWPTIQTEIELLWYTLSFFVLRWTMPTSIRLAAYTGEVHRLSQYYTVTEEDKALLQQNYRITTKETT